MVAFVRIPPLRATPSTGTPYSSNPREHRTESNILMHGLGPVPGLLLGFLLLTSSASAGTNQPFVPSAAALEYKVGDVATEEVIAPVSMVVIDHEETVALKQAEAGRVPVICRYFTNTVNEVENKFRSVFATTRSNFLAQLEAAFETPILTAQNITSPKFQRTTTNFQKRTRLFPVTSALAEVWAQGESDRVMQASLVARLREAMSRPIRAGGSPAPKLTFTVRLLPVSDPGEVLTLDEAEKRSRNSPKNNIIALPTARTELIESFPPEEQALAKFMASLLRTNCAVDGDLTAQARSRRTDPLWAADRYEAGQVIVKPGQIVNRKIKAALNQLREKAAIGSLQERLQTERLNSQQAELRNHWTIAGLGIAIALVLLLFWKLARRKPSGSLLPAIVTRAPAEIMALPGGAAADARERLIPHLARLLTGRFVQKLLSQRTNMLDTQQRAAAEMSELEDRLEKVHAPLQDRLRAYQFRIAELEKELATKGEENRALTKAKIDLVRKQLAAVEEKVGLN
jgi:hypothetical protein